MKITLSSIVLLLSVSSMVAANPAPLEKRLDLGSLVNDATSVLDGVFDTATSVAAGAFETATSFAAGTFETATSKAAGAFSTLTSDAASVASAATSAYASATAKAGQQVSSGVSLNPVAGNWVGIGLGLTIGVVGGLGMILA